MISVNLRKCHIDRSFQLTESFPLFLTGTSVMSVSATDADDPKTENAYLSYSIIGQESIPANAVTKTMFGINNQTGAIYTRDVGLDREVKLRLWLRCRYFQISQDRSCNWNELFSLLGGEKFPIEAADCRYGGHGTDKWRCGNHTRVRHQQPCPTVQPHLSESQTTLFGYFQIFQIYDWK